MCRLLEETVMAPRKCGSMTTFMNWNRVASVLKRWGIPELFQRVLVGGSVHDEVI